MNKITESLIAAALSVGLSGNAKAQEPPQTSCNPTYDSVAAMINFAQANGEELTGYLKDMKAKIDSGEIQPCETAEKTQQRMSPPATPDMHGQKPFKEDLNKLKAGDHKTINDLQKYIQEQVKSRSR